MNKVITTLAIASVFLFSGTGQAMKGEPPRIHPQEIVEQLNLDQTKADALLEMMRNHRDEMRNSRREYSGRSYEQHKLKRENREQHRADIKNLLGEEKFEEFEKLMWEQRQQSRPPKRMN
ncbi:MAG: hypothetical protein GY703_00290 [Gammaproteobacteria bacterium]|nr:hypothetical protein [Gammaproteobacteria bacterium]